MRKFHLPPNHRQALAACFTSLTLASTLSAQTVPDIRSALAQGNYAAAVTAAAATIGRSGASATELADSRFLRAYARLADHVQKDGVTLARQMGAKQAVIDLDDEDATNIQFTDTIHYAKAGLFKAYTVSAGRYTLPQGFDGTPDLVFKNTGSESFNELLLRASTTGEWSAGVRDGDGEFIGYVSGYPDFVSADGWSEFGPSFGSYYPEDEDELPGMWFGLEPGESIVLDMDYADADLRLSLSGGLPAGLTATAAAPFTRSGANFSIKGGFLLPEPALSFENRGTATYTLTLDFTSSGDFGLNFALNGDYAGNLYRSDDTSLWGSVSHGASFEGERLSVPIEPGEVLTITHHTAGPGFRMAVVGTLPKTVTAKNGSYATAVYPQFAKGTTSNTLFAALLKLDTAALQSIVTDLAAIPADHTLLLSAEEAIHGWSTVVEKADREVALALVKTAQAVGLLSRAIDLTVDLSTAAALHSALESEPLQFFLDRKALLATGKGTAAERARLQTLLGQIPDHYLAALDAGLETRAPREEGEYLFAGLAEGGGDPLLIAEIDDAYVVTDQINYAGPNTLAFHNTTSAAQTLVLDLTGGDIGPDYYLENYALVHAYLLLNDESVGELFVDDEEAYAGQNRWDMTDPETGEPVFEAFGDFVPGESSARWTITLPAGAQFRMDFTVAAPGVTLTPVAPPSGLQITLGEGAIAEEDTRAALAEFKSAINGTLPLSAILDTEDMPTGATLSLAPLFAAKPVNLRTSLPQIGANGVRMGDSFRLLRSGLVNGIDITGWESALYDDGALDLYTAPVVTPLKITRQPATVTLAAGASHTLSVLAEGYPVPSYQWVKDGVVLAGETNSTLAITEADGYDIGTYQVRLVGGSHTQAKPLVSAAAKVMVRTAPVIVTPPAVANSLVPASAKGSVTLAVVAQGFGTLKYQWYKAGQPISNARAAKLVLPARAASTGSYHVVVTNDIGSATSDPVSFTVVDLGALPTTTVTLNAGATLNLALTTPANTELTFQWQRIVADDSGALTFEDIPGETSSSYVVEDITGSVAGRYRVVVSLDEATYTSPAVTVAVKVAPASFAFERGKTKSISFTGVELQESYTIFSTGKLANYVYDDELGERVVAGPAYTYKNTGAATATFTTGKLTYRLTFGDDASGGNFTATGTMTYYDEFEDKNITVTIDESGEFSISIEEVIPE